MLRHCASTLSAWVWSARPLPLPRPPKGKKGRQDKSSQLRPAARTSARLGGCQAGLTNSRWRPLTLGTHKGLATPALNWAGMLLWLAMVVVWGGSGLLGRPAPRACRMLYPAAGMYQMLYSSAQCVVLWCMDIQARKGLQPWALPSLLLVMRMGTAVGPAQRRQRAEAQKISRLR